jgi:hypothetical protein
MDDWVYVVLGLLGIAVGSGVVWASTGDDWVDRLFGPEQ